MSDFHPGTRLCALCRMPTGYEDTTVSHCPLCERVMQFIVESHRICGHHKTASDPDPARRRARIEKYKELAASKRQLFEPRDRKG